MSGLYKPGRVVLTCPECGAVLPAEEGEYRTETICDRVCRVVQYEVSRVAPEHRPQRYGAGAP